MAGDAGEKSRLGKIALQQRVVIHEGGDEEVSHPSSRPLASFARQRHGMHLSDELCAFASQQGLPAVDLTQLTWSLEALRLVPRELAAEYQMLPVEINEEGVIVTLSGAPVDAHVEEFRFLIGRTPRLFVTAPRVLRAAIAGAYRALERGQVKYTVHPSLATGNGEMIDERAAALSFDTEGAHFRARGGGSSAPPVELDPAFSEPPQPMQQGGGSELAGKRVLLVVVQPQLRSAIVEGLEGYDVMIECFASGEEALAAMEKRVPDLLLLQAELPGMHGFELCSRLRGTHPALELPIIVISGAIRGWRYAADLRACFGVEHLFESAADAQRLTRALVSSLRGERVVDEPSPLNASADACLRAGMAAFEQGDLDGAIRCLESGAQSGEEVFQLHYHLGLLYGRRGHLFPAIAALETASRLHPRHFSALRNLAVLYQRAGFRHKATETWERAMWSAPDEGTRASIKQHMVGLL